MPFQSDPYGHSSYVYKPTYDKRIERHPDKQPSTATYIRQELEVLRGKGKRKDDVMVLEVRGLGVIVLRLGAKERGCRIFTESELMHLTGDDLAQQIWQDAMEACDARP